MQRLLSKNPSMMFISLGKDPLVLRDHISKNQCVFTNHELMT